MALYTDTIKSLLSQREDPEYDMMDRDAVAASIRGRPAMLMRSDVGMRMLPDRFYSPDFVGIDNRGPIGPAHPSWFPEDHPDFPSQKERSAPGPVGGDTRQEVNAGGDLFAANLSDEEFMKRLMSDTDLNEPQEEPFSPTSTALGSQAVDWLVKNGKISSEDAARAAANLEIPSEIVARIGLGQAFLDQYPSLRESIGRGDATGLIDALSGQFLDQSNSAAIRRRIASGQDAMRRMLTGAALTGSETDEYIARYSPSLTDDARSLLDKTDQLEREIRYIMGALMIGRGGEGLISDLRERAQGMGDGSPIDNPLPRDKTEEDTSGWKVIDGARVRPRR
jgi:hypothetical protein